MFLKRRASRKLMGMEAMKFLVTVDLHELQVTEAPNPNSPLSVGTLFSISLEKGTKISSSVKRELKFDDINVNPISRREKSSSQFPTAIMLNERLQMVITLYRNKNSPYQAKSANIRVKTARYDENSGLDVWVGLAQKELPLHPYAPLSDDSISTHGSDLAITFDKLPHIVLQATIAMVPLVSEDGGAEGRGDGKGLGSASGEGGRGSDSEGGEGGFDYDDLGGEKAVEISDWGASALSPAVRHASMVRRASSFLVADNLPTNANNASSGSLGRGLEAAPRRRSLLAQRAQSHLSSLFGEIGSPGAVEDKDTAGQQKEDNRDKAKDEIADTDTGKGDLEEELEIKEPPLPVSLAVEESPAQSSTPPPPPPPPLNVTPQSRKLSRISPPPSPIRTSPLLASYVHKRIHGVGAENRAARGKGWVGALLSLLLKELKQLRHSQATRIATPVMEDKETQGDVPEEVVAVAPKEDHLENVESVVVPIDNEELLLYQRKLTEKDIEIEQLKQRILELEAAAAIIVPAPATAPEPALAPAPAPEPVSPVPAPAVAVESVGTMTDEAELEVVVVAAGTGAKGVDVGVGVDDNVSLGLSPEVLAGLEDIEEENEEEDGEDVEDSVTDPDVPRQSMFIAPTPPAASAALRSSSAIRTSTAPKSLHIPATPEKALKTALQSLSESREENEGLQQQVREMGEALHEAADKIVRLCVMRAELEEENENYVEKVEQYKAYVSKLYLEINALRKANIFVRQQVDDIRERYTEMEVKYRMSTVYASRDLMNISTDVATSASGKGGGGSSYKYNGKVVNI